MPRETGMVKEVQRWLEQTEEVQASLAQFVNMTSTRTPTKSPIS